MKGKFKYQESRGLPGGPNEMFTYVTGVFSTEGYKRNSPDVNNPYNVIPSGNITMKGVDFPVVGTDNLGNTKMMMPGKDYKFPGDMVFEVPVAQDGIEVKGRKGVRQNPDGTVSTHLMAREYVPDRGWVAFPTLFQNEDGTWMEMPMDKGWGPTYEEAVKRGEVYDFGEDEKAAIKFADEGSWKLPKAQEGNGETPLTRREIFNVPRTMAYEDGKMVVQDKPIWDGMLDEVTITPYTQNHYWSQYMINNKATGGLEPVYPVFDILSLGLKTPLQAGAKSFQAAVKKAPSKINPNYYNPNMLAKGNPNIMYREVGKDAFQDFANSGLVRTKAEITDDPIMGLLETRKEIKDVLRFNKQHSPFQYRHATDFRAPFFSRGKTTGIRDGSADYLIQTRPDRVGPDNFYSAQWNILHGNQPPAVGGFGIMDPMVRSADNFDVFKKSWWHGYKPIKQDGGEAAKIAAQQATGYRPQATVSQYTPPSTGEYLLNKLANPMTTLGYIVRGQQVPDRVEDKGNAYDLAFDIINPAAWLDYGIKSYNDFKEGDVVGGTLNALGAVPAVPAGVSYGDDVIRAATKTVNKVPEVVNPNYFKPNPNMYYRGVGKEGMKDALQSGVFRAKPHDMIPARNVDLGSLGKIDMAKRFDATYYSPNFKVADRYGAGYIVEVPKDAANFRSRYKGSNWSMATKDQIPISQGQLLEKNWWSGYTPIKQEGGEETSWTDYINPMNWGVSNRDEDGDFKQAFRAARNAGDDEFMWHGTRYNTEIVPSEQAKPEEQKPSYNPNILKGLSEEQTARRQALLNAANVVANAQDNDENLRRLLVMSAVMENTLGADANAYSRDYTRGPMSIDDIAYQDLFAVREGARGYTAQQKKNAEWLNQLGLDASNIEQTLRADDPLAGMAAARLVYGRAPEALPSGEDPDALYNYYLKYYNKGGVDKYGGADAHKKKFTDFYNQIYRQEGGEQNQFQIYKDYVYGVYDGTEMAKTAEKVYDKLNRVYYKEAKGSGTTVPNYIISTVMKQANN